MGINEILNIINTLSVETHSSNYQTWERIDKKVGKDDIYSPATDRYYHVAERKLPQKDISEEAIYETFIVKSGLDKCFTKEEFNVVYNNAMILKGMTDSFYFDEIFLYTLIKYVYYQDYLKNNEEKITFENFLEQGIYNKLKREAQNKVHEKETKEIQEAFVPKTKYELKELYDKDKFFIEKCYYNLVVKLDCQDKISFGEFLKIYDMADRNYYNLNMNINDRISIAVANKYYELIVANTNYKETITFEDFYGLFMQCRNMEKPEDFKINISNLIEQHIDKINDNVDLDSLYQGRSK